MLAKRRFPEFCFRGVRNGKDHIDSNGLVTAKLFYYSSNKEVLKKRESRGLCPAYEISINWADNYIQALDLLHNDEDNSKDGVLTIPLAHLEKVKKYMEGKLFSWERAPIPRRKSKPENPYHGNLLYLCSIEDESLCRARHRQISAVIAAGLERPMSREEVQCKLEQNAPEVEAKMQNSPINYLIRVISRLFK